MHGDSTKPKCSIFFFFGSNTVFPTTYRMSFTKIRFYLTKHLIYYDIYSHNSIQSLKRVLALFKSHKRLSYVTWIYTDCGKIADFLQKTRLNIFKNMLIRLMTFSASINHEGEGVPEMSISPKILQPFCKLLQLRIISQFKTAKFKSE